MHSCWSVTLFLAHVAAASVQSDGRRFLTRLPCFAALLWACSFSAKANADLEVISSASPDTGLVVGSEVLVSTTLRNNGPDPIWMPSSNMLLEESEPFWFQFVGPETPGCVFEPVLVDPPRFVYTWGVESIAVGQQVTCVARLRVQLVPAGGLARLAVVGGHYGPEVPGAPNQTEVLFRFGSTIAGSAHTIPTLSTWGLALLAVGVAALGWRTRGCAALIVASSMVSQASAANPPSLFTEVLDASADAPPRVLSKFAVKVNFAALDGNSDSFLLTLPASTAGSYSAERVRFEARASGGYHWIGKTAEHDVVLTVDGDWITGFIRGGPDTYSIMSRREGGNYTYSLSRMDVDAFPSDLVEGDTPFLKAADVTSGAHLKSNLEEHPQAQCFGAADEPIDVLVVYSPEALALAGGDTGLLGNQLANAEAGANVTLANSNVPATIRIIAAEPAPAGLEEVGTAADLTAAREHLGLRSRRRLLKADVVVFLTTKGVNDGTPYCGITTAQRRAGDKYFGMGYDFYENAVLVLTHQCGIQNNDLSHEIGHIVGLDHNPQSTVGTHETNIFPFAFGHYVNFFFRDDMSMKSYCLNDCDRQMFFSDPNMTYMGYPRGTAFRNNAEAYRRMYRCTNTLADFIFVDNFE